MRALFVVGFIIILFSVMYGVGALSHRLNGIKGGIMSKMFIGACIMYVIGALSLIGYAVSVYFFPI